MQLLFSSLASMQGRMVKLSGCSLASHADLLF
jgi:hypothetical protein